MHESLEGEIWKDLNTNYKDINIKYQVSNLGRVRNTKTTHILSPSVQNGYAHVTLKGHHCGVYRLVAFAFLDFEGNQDDYEVDHINKNPSDNFLENLQIMTKTKHSRKDHGARIVGLSIDNKYVIFDSMPEAAQKLDTATSNIAGALKRCKDAKEINKSDETDIVDLLRLNGMAKEYYWHYYDSEEAQFIIANYEKEIFEQDEEEFEQRDEIKPELKQIKPVTVIIPKLNSNNSNNQSIPNLNSNNSNHQPTSTTKLNSNNSNDQSVPTLKKVIISIDLPKITKLNQS